ncbi:MAG: hypothetical protein V3W44_08455 [Dehalococcoidales bacterium]
MQTAQIGQVVYWESPDCTTVIEGTLERIFEETEQAVIQCDDATRWKVAVYESPLFDAETEEELRIEDF